MRMMIQFAIISLLALLSIPSTASAQSCTANPVAVQILGSGGPGFNHDRASSSYLLWINAQASHSGGQAACPAKSITLD
jgi:hypothetical protein